LPSPTATSARNWWGTEIIKSTAQQNNAQQNTAQQAKIIKEIVQQTKTCKDTAQHELGGQQLKQQRTAPAASTVHGSQSAASLRLSASLQQQQQAATDIIDVASRNQKQPASGFGSHQAAGAVRLLHPLAACPPSIAMGRAGGLPKAPEDEWNQTCNLQLTHQEHGPPKQQGPTLATATAASDLPLSAPLQTGTRTEQNLEARDGKWSMQEDEKLRAGVAQIGEKNWRRIASDFCPTRSHSQCLHRWQKISKPGLVKGNWTPEEDSIVIECIKAGIAKWSAIASRLPGRFGKQCRERWHNHLDPNVKQTPWTTEEDALLVNAHAELGDQWIHIQKRIPGRSDNSIKSRWNSAKFVEWHEAHRDVPKPSMPFPDATPKPAAAAVGSNYTVAPSVVMSGDGSRRRPTGVHWCPKAKKWEVSISAPRTGVVIQLGMFDEQEQALAMYDEVAKGVSSSGSGSPCGGVVDDHEEERMDDEEDEEGGMSLSASTRPIIKPQRPVGGLADQSEALNLLSAVSRAVGALRSPRAEGRVGGYTQQRAPARVATRVAARRKPVERKKRPREMTEGETKERQEQRLKAQRRNQTYNETALWAPHAARERTERTAVGSQWHLQVMGCKLADNRKNVKVCKDLLDTMKKHKFGWIFAEPVDHVKVKS
jgi:hypothetical protein